jgi:hypothetical protein
MGDREGAATKRAPAARVVAMQMRDDHAVRVVERDPQRVCVGGECRRVVAPAQPAVEQQRRVRVRMR